MNRGSLVVGRERASVGEDPIAAESHTRLVGLYAAPESGRE